MADNDSLQKGLENPPLMDLLENQIKSIKPPEDSFCTEIFGELHFKEIPLSPSFPSKKADGISSKKTKSLHHCTEILGLESTDIYVEESKNGSEVERKNHEMEKKEKDKVSTTEENLEFSKSKMSSKSFPPPLTCLGKRGKPRVCFTAYRFDGRLILVENKIPTEEEEEIEDYDVEEDGNEKEV